MTALLQVRSLGKHFTVHAQGSMALPVFSGIDLDLAAGECIALTGHSGSGKSSLMRCLYGNYGASAGTIGVRHRGGWLDLAQAAPREVLDVRRHTIGYVSQFLRVIPRIAAIELVAEPLRRLAAGAAKIHTPTHVDIDTDAETDTEAHAHAHAKVEAAQWLRALNLPEPLWSLPPATFSGGEQQRVNIARGLIAQRPILLLDEPTASLDADNRQRVVDIVRQARDQGAGIVGIFHDADVRAALATRVFDVEARHG